MPDSPSLGEQEPRTKFQEPIEEKDFWFLILGLVVPQRLFGYTLIATSWLAWLSICGLLAWA